MTINISINMNNLIITMLSIKGINQIMIMISDLCFKIYFLVFELETWVA